MLEEFVGIMYIVLLVGGSYVLTKLGMQQRQIADLKRELEEMKGKQTEPQS